MTHRSQHHLCSPFGPEAEAEGGILAALEAAVGPTNSISSAGKIARYLKNWLDISENKFILRIVAEGYKLQFLNNPVLPPSVSSSTTNPKRHLVLANQIQKLLVSGAISKVPFSCDLVLSRIFTVKKANGDDRMILDLSKLNTQIVKVSFQMETHSKILELLHKNDFMASIDLSDAFFSIPVHDSHKKFIAFEFDDCHFTYNVLPFGLTSSPRIFSKMLKPAIIFLRSQGVKVSFYLDDIFLCSSSSDELQSHITQTLNLLVSLGFTPNYKKFCCSTL
jgi:hypothetical protein